MLRYVFRRLLQVIPALFGVSLLTFFILPLTGDPASAILGPGATPQAIAEFRQAHGLNDPLFQQYFRWLGNALRGDLGLSHRYQEPITKLLLARLPATLELTGAALALALIVGLPIGIMSAVRWNSAWDVIARGIVLFCQAIPGFYLALLLIIVFSLGLRILPTGGRGGITHLILPATALGAYLVALIVRITRSSLLDVLGSEYIRTARAKGLPERLVILRHALRNSLIPLITVIGVQVALLLGGAVVTETVFSWPGIGLFAVRSIYTRDFPCVQAVILFVAVIAVCANLLVDIAYAMLDPTIRLE